MNTNQKLHEELDACFSEWEGQFNIDIEHTRVDCSYAYFSVVVKHKILGQAYEFDARASKSQEIEIAGCGDDWCAIDKATLFACMWFETAQVRDK